MAMVLLRSLLPSRQVWETVEIPLEQFCGDRLGIHTEMVGSELRSLLSRQQKVGTSLRALAFTEVRPYFHWIKGFFGCNCLS